MGGLYGWRFETGFRGLGDWQDFFKNFLRYYKSLSCHSARNLYQYSRFAVGLSVRISSLREDCMGGLYGWRFETGFRGLGDWQDFFTKVSLWVQF